jgi:DNA-binding transcriptional regulator PaaX
MTSVQYYLKKPKAEITKDILLWLAVAGAITVGGTAPYLLQKLFCSLDKKKKYKKRSVETAFYRLRRAGALLIERKGHQYEVHLTQEGKKKAGWLQINALKVSTVKQWEGEWYVLLFDVSQKERWKRDVLRSFLERLGFVLLQKSVWVHAYKCREEIAVLKEFLGLTSKEVKLLTVRNLGEDEKRFRQYFHL